MKRSGDCFFIKASEGVNSQVPKIWVGPYADGTLENLIKLSAEGENAKSVNLSGKRTKFFHFSLSFFVFVMLFIGIDVFVLLADRFLRSAFLFVF